MKVFTFLLLICYIPCFGQGYLIDLRIKRVEFQGDSVVNEIPKEFEIITDNVTEIIEVARVGKTTIGIKLEVLASKIDDNFGFMLAKAYYSKIDGEIWQRINLFNHSAVNVSDLANRREEEAKRQERIKKEPNSKRRQMYLRTNSDSVGDPPTFKIEYYLDVYFNQ